MRTLLLLVVVGLTLATTPVSARSKKVTLTIHSNPEGALLTVNGTRWGATPLSLLFDVGKFRECQNTGAVSVRWASGAEAAVTGVAICPSVGTKQTFTLDRPVNVDGLALDLQVAFQQTMLAQMRAQADALSELDYEAWLLTLNGSQRAAAAPKPFALCVSRDVARGVVYVACQ